MKKKKNEDYRCLRDTACKSSTGIGKTIVELRSAAICVNVCKYLNCITINGLSLPTEASNLCKIRCHVK